MQLVVDAHLDLAANASAGFDLTVSAHERRRRETHRASRATVGLPDLRRGNVAVVFGTLFCAPEGGGLGSAVVAPMDDETMPSYRTPEQAERIALSQLDVYRRWEAEGHIRIVATRGDLDRHLVTWADDGVPGLVVLMEGADPIVAPGDVGAWWDRGLRIVGLAWTRTRYAGGTGAPGPLTAAGRDLLSAMADVGMALDLSHLAEEACIGALEYTGPVCVTHAHPRALSDTDRQIGDEVLDVLAERDTVMGLTMAGEFLDPSWHERGVLPTLGEHWRAHAAYLGERIGWGRVGIGSDLDGGFGADETPEDIDTVADIRRIGEVVPVQHRASVLGGNWIGWLRRALPA
jgi:membrane dipeptidase